MTAVGLGVDADHAGDVGAFDVAAIEQVLAQVVEFVGDDSTADSNGVVSVFSDCAVQQFGEPPDALVPQNVPFLWYLLATEKKARLISTRN